MSFRFGSLGSTPTFTPPPERVPLMSRMMREKFGTVIPEPVPPLTDDGSLMSRMMREAVAKSMMPQSSPIDEEAAKRAAEEERRRIILMRGRTSTILTRGTGVGGNPVLMRKTLLGGT